MQESPTNPFGVPRVDRIMSAQARAGVERLAYSKVLIDGCVNLICLDAIRREMDDTWAAKRELVWEHVERDLERRLGPFDKAYRLDETLYLIAMPPRTRHEAQGLCMQILQDVLTFFIGESRSGDVVIRNVTAITGSDVHSAPLDLGAVTRDLVTPPEPHEEHEHTTVWRPALDGRIETTTFVGQSRKSIEVKLCVKEVWNLRRDLVTSFLIERATFPHSDDPSDLLHVDVAVMDHVSQLLHEHKQTGGRLTLHAPMSFSSVASIRSRELSIKMMRHVFTAMRETTLIEISDLDPGVPPSRLVEVVSLTQPFCLGVLARVRPSRKALDAVRGCGLKGLILEAKGLGRTPAETAALLKAFAEAARGIAPNLIVHGLDDPRLIDAAKAAGLTHASVRPDFKVDQAASAA